MARKSALETLKRDNLLVDIIFQHKGKSNAIGTKEIVQLLTEKGYEMRADILHQTIRRVVTERRLPICSVCHHGYYWATSKKDVQNAIDDLQGKIQGLQERIDLLKNFIYE